MKSEMIIDECNRSEEDNPQRQPLSRTDLGFRPQKELVYNKLLPYADKLDVESQVWLAQIKGNLGRAVMLRELKPGCVFWTSRLNM